MLKKRNTEPQTASLSELDDAISRRLVDARLNAEALPDFPDRLPVTLEQAYAIQTASISRWPDEVAGWKVGLLSEIDCARLSAERLAGPIFKSTIHNIESGSRRTMPIYVGGFAAVEAEFVFEIGEEIQPSGKVYSDEELTAIVSAMYVGAEIASSPMALVNKLGPTCVASDFGNNLGLLVGPEVTDWQTRSSNSLVAAVTIDGVIAGNASAEAIPGGPLRALSFLLELCSTRDLTLPRGTLVSTGATTGVHEVTVGSNSRVDFGDLGFFDVGFEAMSLKHYDR